MTSLTNEQLDIVNAPTNQHNTVLAVAGSGKTITMCHRIKALVQRDGVAPETIRALMYNTEARSDFDRKLESVGITSVEVSTLHGLGWGVLNWAMEQGLHQEGQLLSDGRDVDNFYTEVLKEYKRRNPYRQDQPLDRDVAKGAIGTWKAMLTPPESAGHSADDRLPEVYRLFEEMRAQQRLITFDDQIYDAVRLLNSNSEVREKITNQLDHIIVDEFQDVNYARLRLIQHVAGSTAKVTVVGDDDQCIYEWQGARSSYIKRGFREHFTSYPHASFKLSRSFRFGPEIAQLASNVIGHNTDRVEKELVAHDLAKKSVIEELDGGDASAGGRILELLEDGVPASEIAVLARKYSQTYEVQGVLSARAVPYLVEGEGRLVDQYPARLLRHYLRLVDQLDEPLGAESVAALRDIVNVPYRAVSKTGFGRLLDAAHNQERSVGDFLGDAGLFSCADLGSRAVSSIARLSDLLRRARTDSSGALRSAGDAAGLLALEVDFRAAFSSFLGASRVESYLGGISALVKLLGDAAVDLADVEQFVARFDTRLGRPEAECVRFTSIFKAKGRKWDHVFLPGLIDGQCPDLRDEVDACYDTKDPNRNPDATIAIESERRLFYVGVTRPRVGLYFSYDASTERRRKSRFLHEAQRSQTLDSVSAMQGLLSGIGLGSRLVERIASGAQADAHLAQGLRVMLARATVEAPSERLPDLQSALVAVTAARSRPFSYLEPYPRADRSPAPSVPSARNRLRGLPF